MTRPLGSFNSRPRLPQHQDDHKVQRDTFFARKPEASIGYDLGINRNTTGRQEYVPSGADRFVSGQRKAARVTTGMRMAGQALDPQLGSAEEKNQTSAS
jgi:hypothetical protein